MLTLPAGYGCWRCCAGSGRERAGPVLLTRQTEGVTPGTYVEGNVVGAPVRAADPGHAGSSHASSPYRVVPVDTEVTASRGCRRLYTARQITGNRRSCLPRLTSLAQSLASQPARLYIVSSLDARVAGEKCGLSVSKGPFSGLPRNGWVDGTNIDHTGHQVDLLPIEIVAPPSRAGVDGPEESSGGGRDRISEENVPEDSDGLPTRRFTGDAELQGLDGLPGVGGDADCGDRARGHGGEVSRLRHGCLPLAPTRPGWPMHRPNGD